MKTHAQVRDQLGFHEFNPSTLQTFGSDHRRHYKGSISQKEGFWVYKWQATKYPDSTEDLDFNYFKKQNKKPSLSLRMP